MNRMDLYCYCCGASLEALPQPLGRLAECLACRSELHVCRMCEFYDPAVSQACREPMAEEVKDKTRANFCEYFSPRPGPREAAKMPAGEDSRRGLEALFGGDADAGRDGDHAGALDDLFRDD